MAYFEKEFIQFFKDLEQNNNKEWFTANKKTYEKYVKKPFKGFVEDIIPRLSELDPDIKMEAKDAIFRINRDLRFSKDKTPYNTLVKCGFSKGGRNSPYASFYLGLSGYELHIGGGVYMPDKEQLLNIRKAIAKSPDEFMSITNERTFSTTFGKIKGKANKRIPSEFQKLFASVPLIANKQFYYMADFNVESHIFDKNLLEFVMQQFKTGSTLNNFLKRATAI